MHAIDDALEFRELAVRGSLTDKELELACRCAYGQGSLDIGCLSMSLEREYARCLLAFRIHACHSTCSREMFSYIFVETVNLDHALIMSALIETFKAYMLNKEESARAVQAEQLSDQSPLKILPFPTHGLASSAVISMRTKLIEVWQ